MKNIFIILLGCFFSFSTFAKSGYDILINEDGYDLKIKLEFNNFQSLNNIRKALTSSAVISRLSPNIKSITNIGNPDNYESLMVVKSFGIKSELLSKCSETYNKNKWSRSCVLQTEMLDSGKFMVSKSDQVSCTKIDQQKTSCLFSIKGKTKPLSLLGIQILNERSFAVKAKVQALNNFFKLFYFINDYNISTQLALKKFDQSIIKNEIEDFDHDGTLIFKKELSYNRSFLLPEVL